jgi:hypothetical protein
MATRGGLLLVVVLRLRKMNRSRFQVASPMHYLRQSANLDCPNASLPCMPCWTLLPILSPFSLVVLQRSHSRVWKLCSKSLLEQRYEEWGSFCPIHSIRLQCQATQVCSVSSYFASQMDVLVRCHLFNLFFWQVLRSMEIDLPGWTCRSQVNFWREDMVTRLLHSFPTPIHISFWMKRP